MTTNLQELMVAELEYKFLGWQNGWVISHYDINGNITKDRDKSISYEFNREGNPEYTACKKTCYTNLVLNK